MPEQAYTLDVVLGLDGPAVERLAAVAGGRCLDELRGAARERLSPAWWGAVAAQTAGKIREVLALPIADVLARAWSGYEPFLKYVDRDRYPPGEVSLVPLATHTIESKHTPYVELRLNDRPAGRIDVEVVVTITLEGAVLAIEDGKFRELRVGSGKVEGALSCEGEEILRRPAEASFPGVLSFGEGIPIVPLPREEEAAVPA